MTPKLPEIIKSYIAASNAHDVKAILTCFADDALVSDEGQTLSGREAIESWIVKTIEKYKFQFKPLNVIDEPPNIFITMEVSGTFDGSPIILDYHFLLDGEKIASLGIN
jgi:ketosteroid isomerase-like protein